MIGLSLLVPPLPDAHAATISCPSVLMPLLLDHEKAFPPSAETSVGFTVIVALVFQGQIQELVMTWLMTGLSRERHGKLFLSLLHSRLAGLNTIVPSSKHLLLCVSDGWPSAAAERSSTSGDFKLSIWPLHWFTSAGSKAASGHSDCLWVFGASLDSGTKLICIVL